jgi:hypothetical protein
MGQATKAASNRARLLVVMGCLWLSLAAGYFYYQLTNPAVAVTWETATEINTAGFNIYRSTSEAGEFVQINEAEGLIPGQGDTFSGAAYRFWDQNVAAGMTYYYVLEEVEYDQTRNRYDEDMLTHYVPYVTQETSLILTVMILFGLGLIVMGLREDKII